MNPTHGRPAGLFASLRAGISAGALAGLVIGLGDGVTAALLTRATLGVGGALGCLAAAVLQYGLLFAAATAVVALVAHPVLRRRELGPRYRILLTLALGAGLFAPLYWWTRPWVFYGAPATSPQRLGAALVFALVALALGALLARVLTRQPMRVQWGLAACIGCAWLGGGLYLAAQQTVGSERGRLNERNRDLPNVLLVVVDALRQDTLGCYGHPRVQSPHIDALAKEGVLFENFFVDAPFTWTSFGSLLTGKYPRRHGLMKMKPGVVMEPTTTLPAWLDHARRKDGLALQRGDVAKASFHTGTLQERSGLLRGFDLVFEETAGHDLADLDSAWSQFRSELLLWVFVNRFQKRFDSGLVASEAGKWLDQVADRRFFAMVHLYSTHTPYDPPAEFKALYRDPAYSGPIVNFYAEHRRMIEEGKYTPTPGDIEQVRNLYYGGVSQADALIGKLLDTLRARGVLDQTLVIVTSDHGESLGEDGLWEHNHHVRRELRVPLLLRLPAKLPAGRRVAALTDQIDVFPTVCDLLGLELPPQDSVREQIDGQSLLAHLGPAPGTPREHVFAENGTAVTIQTLGARLTVPRAILEGATPEAARREFEEDLRRPDPESSYVEYAGQGLEEQDRIRERVEAARELFLALDAWSRRMPIPVSSVVRSHRDEDDLRTHDNLGYDEGRPPPRKEPGKPEGQGKP